MRFGLLVVISGPGGVGKDTLIEKIRERDHNLLYSVSYTTRPRRPYEIDDVHYSFVTANQFQELVASGALLEHAIIAGHLYGTAADRVEDAQAKGRDVILKIDVQGGEALRIQRPDAVFLFISPPSMEALMERRRVRGTESDREMEERQKIAQTEMSYARHYDHVIINDDADRAATELLDIIAAERIARSSDREPGEVNS